MLKAYAKYLRFPRSEDVDELVFRTEKGDILSRKVSKEGFKGRNKGHWRFDDDLSKLLSSQRDR